MTCIWCEEDATPLGGDATEHARFIADLDSLLSAAFYCAVQGAEDVSKVDMFQDLKKKFIENHGHL